MFGFWDWVGGRYSMDSAIGLSTMIALGPDQFRQLLDGFHAMDEHFRTAPLESNVPALMGLIGLWNRSLLNIPTVAVLPYDQYLKRFPAYLQQMIMESNGKSVTRDGKPVGTDTGAIYWGEPGTNGQHSFYQILHQGTSFIACDVLVAGRSLNPIGEHHDVLVSNALAQATVLAFGRSVDQLQAAGVPEHLISHKEMPGNRPTTVLFVNEVDPFTLGALVAMYEHMTFVQGIVWGINSFDQWGVELGKEMAVNITPYLTNSDDTSSFDAATAQAIDWYRTHKA
jgi:glucose-6-phosphate isomerase